MRVFVVGGTGFIGRHVVERLAAQGHQITVLHRRRKSAELPAGVDSLEGDRASLLELGGPRLDTDVAIDMICGTEADGRLLMSAFERRTARVVVISSADVYRAYDVAHGKDTGPPQPAPIPEDADLRASRYPYRGRPVEVFDWLTGDYDKILVEQAVSGPPQLAATILRLPMVFGPGDPLHRFRPYLLQMDGGGAGGIALEEGAAAWRGCWGYVENVAAAIALAATDPRAAGRVYNVADYGAATFLEWLRALARAAGWRGRIAALPRERMPADAAPPFNHAQHWVTDTTRIRRELGFLDPLDRHEALARTVAWERTCG